MSFQWAGLVGGVLLLAACVEAEAPPPPPTAAEVAALYSFGGELEVTMSGNVAQVAVVIDRAEFQRGGPLWAQASPYIFLFSPATREAIETYRGLGGVRVLVRYEDGSLVAQALLDRSALNSGEWARALNIAGLARTEGTQSPGHMRDLVRWGEDHTDFEYNSAYIPGRS